MIRSTPRGGLVGYSAPWRRLASTVAAPDAVDYVVIGAGHNALVASHALAKTGRSVFVSERREVVGGAAVTEEFAPRDAPGFRNSVAAYSVSLLSRKVVDEMELETRHGLRLVRRPGAHFVPTEDGAAALQTSHRLEETQRAVAAFSPKDAAALPAFYAMLDGVVASLTSVMHTTPPPGLGGIADAVQAMEAGGALSRLGIKQRRDLLELFTASAGDLLDAWFESEPLKGMLAFDAVTGAFESVYAPGSAYVLLHHCFGDVFGETGVWGHAVGGMGAITQAMAAACRAEGAMIECGNGVERILARDGKAIGVYLNDGRLVKARRGVVSGVSPTILAATLLAPSDVDAVDDDFRPRMDRYKTGSGTLRINVALDELPDFTVSPGQGDGLLHHQSSMLFSPSIDYIETALSDAKRIGWARRPVIEMMIPSTIDSTLAPTGKHVASLFCQHFHPGPVLPRGGTPSDDRAPRTWDDARDAAAAAVIDLVTEFAPNFRQSIVGMRVLTPTDLDREFGLPRGDIFHGQLTLGQMFSARPVLGYGAYRGPLQNLWMCGSGTHPGGGVTGIPGRNCAREILSARRRGVEVAQRGWNAVVRAWNDPN